MNHPNDRVMLPSEVLAEYKEELESGVTPMLTGPNFVIQMKKDIERLEGYVATGDKWPNLTSPDYVQVL